MKVILRRIKLYEQKKNEKGMEEGLAGTIGKNAKEIRTEIW